MINDMSSQVVSELGQVGTKIDQVNSSIIESNLKKLGDIEGAQNFINIVIGLLSGLIFALIFILFRKLL
ncbi:MAG: hypothetical protein DRO04_03220 [Candidatus Iainarchaeum archaeon]|uniref:Uncharacterized protein n=1 Tax=Candidatus Iainarchaeum sp. TaxID=3101447 RepID=A0A497JG42_9ARCH|nr:MAG: hypothetical protein DRO04_03220 [Candidatus Diapherotrites archaeon]